MTATKASKTPPPLLIDNKGRLRIITLNRPDRLNALTPELHHWLQEAVLDAAKDETVGALVLTGAGRAFCAGGDIKRSTDKQKQSPQTREQRADALRQHAITTMTLHTMPKPTMAIINGAAAGSGLALALACDFRWMQQDAKLRTAYAAIGLSGDLGISYYLTTLVGTARARELLMLNEKIDAATALSYGLVTRIYEDAEDGLAMAEKLSLGPPLAHRMMKENINLAETATLEQVTDREANNSVRCIWSHDAREAALAFKEKRSPKFENR